MKKSGGTKDDSNQNDVLHRIDQTIETILASGALGNSERRANLLRYLVSLEESGKGSTIKAYSIALDVFGRAENFDPNTDSIVRVEIGRLRKALRLEGARAALLNEFGRPFTADIAHIIKALPVRHAGLLPMDEAISTAGGLRFDALDGFRVAGNSHVYAAGEMLDWEAPTGGYLINGCLATGHWAGRHAVDWARR